MKAASAGIRDASVVDRVSVIVEAEPSDRRVTTDEQLSGRREGQAFQSGGAVRPGDHDGAVGDSMARTIEGESRDGAAEEVGCEELTRATEGDVLDRPKPVPGDDAIRRRVTGAVDEKAGDTTGTGIVRLVILPVTYEQFAR